MRDFENRTTDTRSFSPLTRPRDPRICWAPAPWSAANWSGRLPWRFSRASRCMQGCCSLRRQLALYVERGVKPRRIDAARFSTRSPASSRSTTLNAIIRASQINSCGPPLSSRHLSQCTGASASVECSTSTTAQLSERLRSSFWKVRRYPNRRPRSPQSCRVATRIPSR